MEYAELLQGKNAIKPPEGLYELCFDLSREVILFQPDDIYGFVADYLESLLVTRENAKVAVKVIDSVVLESEHILEVLCCTGLQMDQIAAVAPRLQKAFRAYLNRVEEIGKADDDDTCSSYTGLIDPTEISVYKILLETGASCRQAIKAATKIQALFRGHHERLLLAEERGEVTWQRASINTMEILRRAGITRCEAASAAITIQAAYRGYYARKNLKSGATKVEGIDGKAYMEMMFENSGLTEELAYKAAAVIQRTYRKYRERRLLIDQGTPCRSSVASSDQINIRKKREADYTLNLIDYYYTDDRQSVEDGEVKEICSEEDVSRAGDVSQEEEEEKEVIGEVQEEEKSQSELSENEEEDERDEEGD